LPRAEPSGAPDNVVATERVDDNAPRLNSLKTWTRLARNDTKKQAKRAGRVRLGRFLTISLIVAMGMDDRGAWPMLSWTKQCQQNATNSLILLSVIINLHGLFHATFKDTIRLFARLHPATKHRLHLAWHRTRPSTPLKLFKYGIVISRQLGVLLLSMVL
jgi:hypothetical protein